MKLGEDLKNELRLVSYQLKDIANVLQRSDKTEKEIYDTRVTIADMNQRLLLKEEEIELIEKKVENNHKDYNKKIEKCTKIVNSMKTDNDKLLEKLENNNTISVERLNEQNRFLHFYKKEAKISLR